jgi:hypothetical protein
MTNNFPLVKSTTLELALQQWADWVISLDKARKKLGWKALFSEEEWRRWAETLDQDLVWKLALSELDKLEMPRLLAGYWIACLVSSYYVEDIATYRRIRCPAWVMNRMTGLQNTLLLQEPPFGNKLRGGVIEYASGTHDPTERSLPPSYIGVVIPEPPSFVTIHIPRFMFPGLEKDPSALAKLLKRLDTQLKRPDTKDEKHPLSQILRRVGRPIQGSWARKMISGADTHKLRLLYEGMIQSEYAHELVESLSPKQLEKVAKFSGEMAHDVLMLGYHAERLVPKKERTKIRDRVRKRVTGWFKRAKRWPLPEDEAQ